MEGLENVHRFMPAMAILWRPVDNGRLRIVKRKFPMQLVRKGMTSKRISQ
jgi:hypothetical protein